MIERCSRRTDRCAPCLVRVPTSDKQALGLRDGGAPLPPAIDPGKPKTITRGASVRLDVEAERDGAPG